MDDNSKQSKSYKSRFSYENKYYYYTSLNDEIERIIQEGQDYFKKYTKSNILNCTEGSVSGFENRIKFCSFCKKNDEPNLVYNAHNLRNNDGKITCPVLRQCVCSVCGASGDKAHTQKYCPNN